MANRPGGEMATRPLHFIWIVDCSGSMQGKKIETVNFAIQDSTPEMQKVADENPNAQVLVRALKFSDGAQWHVSQPTDVKAFKWVQVDADGVTDMGKALSMVAEQLKTGTMPERGLPPVLVLLTDGQPTDDFASGLKALMDQPWGRKSVRIGIGIGDDADLEVLEKFIGNPEVKPLKADNARTLVRYIKWASTVPLKAASSPASQSKDSPTAGTNVPIPAPPDGAAGPISATDVF